LISEIEEESIQKWQKKWNECTKTKIKKQFFPRLKMNRKVTPNFAAMVTGLGETRAYFHCFKIRD